MSNYIFVYGTLKKGEINHHLMAGAEYVDVGLAPGCVLLDLGGCPALMPFHVTGQDNHHTATGEIYRIPDPDLPSLLSRLDKLESEGSMYLRAKLKITARTKQFECITYIYMPNIGARIVNNGWWTPTPGSISDGAP